MPRRPAGVQVDEPLVGTAPEPEGQVLQLLYEAAVHQHIQQGEHLVCHLAAGMSAVRGKLLIGEAGEAPDGLVRIHLPDPPEKGHQGPLVLRFKGLAPQQCQAVDVDRGEQGEQIILRLGGKGLAVAEVPGLGLKAVLAVIGAARDEQGDPHSLAIGNVAVFDLTVVHDSPPAILQNGRPQAPI